jgi:hypothetical protein
MTHILWRLPFVTLCAGKNPKSPANYFKFIGTSLFNLESETNCVYTPQSSQNSLSNPDYEKK